MKLRVLHVYALIIFTCISCATAPYQPPTECIGKESFIIENINNNHFDWNTVKRLVTAANYVALYCGAYEPHQALLGIQLVRNTILVKDATFAEVFTSVPSFFHKAGEGNKIYAIIPILVMSLNRPIPISDCDRVLLLQLVDEQEVMINSFFWKGGTT